MVESPIAQPRVEKHKYEVNRVSINISKTSQKHFKTTPSIVVKRDVSRVRSRRHSLTRRPRSRTISPTCKRADARFPRKFVVWRKSPKPNCTLNLAMLQFWSRSGSARTRPTKSMNVSAVCWFKFTHGQNWYCMAGVNAAVAKLNSLLKWNGLHRQNWLVDLRTLLYFLQRRPCAS